MQAYTVHHVRYSSEGHEGVRTFGSYRDPAEARSQCARMNERSVQVKLGTQYFTEEEEVSTDFIIPGKVQPRDLYFEERMQRPSKPGCWDVQDVTVYKHFEDDRDPLFIARYHRDYPGRTPFEPFRQFRDGREHHYALVSVHYQQSDVLDLRSGEVIASEDGNDPKYGFCPVGFYVPDWRDCHDDSSFPGSWYWEEEHDRWPDGTLGFVWGCYWGDDNGWKVQALDLSRIREGVITRDERWGYQYIEAASGDPRKFICVRPGEGSCGPVVTFSVPRQFEVSGKRLSAYDD